MIWNPRNVLSGRNDAAVPSSGPAPGFDPHRTGDPVEPGSSRPSIGFGDTRALPASGASRRRPIGFAPPEQDAGHEQRFRTELSFKRHVSVPLAGTTPRASVGGDEEAPAPWQTAAAVEHDDAEPVGVVEPEDAVTAERVPFYKREISFRRRRGTPDVEGGAAAGEPARDEEPVSGEPAVADAVAGEGAADEVAAKRAGRFARKGWGARAVPKRRPGRGGRGRRVVGVKIGASQLAAAVVVDTDGGPELVELARRPLADGIVVDGEVREKDALANALRAFFDEEGLPKKDVRIGVSSNRIGVRTFDIAGIDDEARFDNAVRFRAHEVLPVAVHESVLDYRVLEERINEAGESTRRVLLVVAPRDQIEPYVEVAGRAGIKLAGVDLEALGLLRAFVDPKPFSIRAVDDTATVVVAIGHESSTLLVAGGGTCEFTRVFDWGGGALQEAIATALEVHPAEAATILRHLSLSGPGRRLDGLDDVARARAVDAVRLRLTPFARELVSSLQFYQTQPESLGIGEIVITGGTSHLEGLGETLHQMIGVNVRLGDPRGRVVAAGPFDPAIEATIGSMAVPIGLAIDDVSMRSVNLLPSDAVRTRSARSSLITIAAPVAAAVPLVALGVLYMGAHGTVGDRQAELDAVAAQIAALPKPQGPEIDARVVGDEAARATAVANVLGGRVAWDGMFRDISRVLPDNVWLKSLSAKEPQPAVSADGTTAAATAATPGQPEAPPTDVTMEGYTYSQPDVARLLARLATLPSLSRVTLTSSQRETVGKKDVVRFVIVAALTRTGGAR